MPRNSTRRAFLGSTALAVGGAATFGARSSAQSPRAADRPPAEPFLYSLNTSTIRGQKLPLDEQVEVAAKAGYNAIEPWLGDIHDYKNRGKSLADLKKRIADLGLTVCSAIGFAEWIVDDDAKRQKGLEQARRDMDVLAQIGGLRIAAPPAGATQQADLNLLSAAERYRKLLEIGDSLGVVPQVEVWGFSKCLNRLGEATLVAVESAHPKACVLADVYHLYKGGSDIAGLRLLAGNAMHVMHMNDYPADPPRATITDGHRVYPGDGVAPLGELLRLLRSIGFRGALSLEVFNQQYWRQDALLVARTGLEKMKIAVRKALG